MHFENILKDLAHAFRIEVEKYDTKSEHPFIEERLLVAKVCENLQRQDPPYIAVNEYPYGDAARKDIRADLKLFAPGSEIPVWVEHKPFLWDYAYWYPSTFFIGQFPKGEFVEAPSPVLDDIEKFNKVEHAPFGFCMSLVVHTGGKELLPNSDPPKARESLLSGQILHLCIERFKRIAGGEPIVRKERSDRGFESVVIGFLKSGN